MGLGHRLAPAVRANLRDAAMNKCIGDYALHHWDQLEDIVGNVVLQFSDVVAVGAWQSLPAAARTPALAKNMFRLACECGRLGFAGYLLDTHRGFPGKVRITGPCGAATVDFCVACLVASCFAKNKDTARWLMRVLPACPKPKHMRRIMVRLYGEAAVLGAKCL